MHEFIIPILIIILIVYLVMPLEKLSKDAYSREVINFIVITVVFATLYSLSSMNLLHLALVAFAMMLLIVRLISRKRALRATMFFVISLLIFANFLEVGIVFYYLGIVFFILLIAIIFKDIVYDDKK